MNPSRFGIAPSAAIARRGRPDDLVEMEDVRGEGRRAFNEKRPPKFTGKLRRRGDAWPELSEEDAKRLDDVYHSGEF